MNKKIFVTLSALLALSALSVNAAPPQKLEKLNQPRKIEYNPDGSMKLQKDAQRTPSSALDKITVYYPNANINSAISKYKNGNYSGCLQELFSLTKKDPSNAVAYYYMALAYTHVDMQDDAIESYEKVIALSPNSYLVDYAVKGRDCLTGGPACQPPEDTGAEEDDLDRFIKAPYGNGLSPELNQEVKQKELINIKETINKKDSLETKDLEKIKKFDNKSNSKSSVEETDKIAQVSDEEILNAVKTLKAAGLNLTVQPDGYSSMMQYQDPQMMEMSMLLGTNNNNNNNSMMNMLPMMMSQVQKGQNIDPRVMQAMMMNSMMPDFSFGSNNDKY